MKYNRSYFESIAEELSNAVSHPLFIEKVDSVRRSPAVNRIEMGKSVYTNKLRELGIAIPDTLRVSARSFEIPTFAASNGLQQPGREPGSLASSSWESMGSMVQEAYDGSTWGSGSDALPEKISLPEVIRKTVYQGLMMIADIVLATEFYQALTEMYELPLAQRAQFVLEVFLNEKERQRRGISLPDSMSLQRSTFYDGRPTLFCVSKKENLAYPWRKLTITFDNEDLTVPSTLSTCLG